MKFITEGTGTEGKKMNGFLFVCKFPSLSRRSGSVDCTMIHDPTIHNTTMHNSCIYKLYIFLCMPSFIQSTFPSILRNRFFKHYAKLVMKSLSS